MTCAGLMGGAGLMAWHREPELLHQIGRASGGEPGVLSGAVPLKCRAAIERQVLADDGSILRGSRVGPGEEDVAAGKVKSTGHGGRRVSVELIGGTVAGGSVLIEQDAFVGSAGGRGQS